MPFLNTAELFMATPPLFHAWPARIAISPQLCSACVLHMQTEVRYLKKKKAIAKYCTIFNMAFWHGSSQLKQL